DALAIVESAPGEAQEPQTLEEAMSSPHYQHWREAVNDEISSWIGNQVFEEVPLIPGTKTIDTRFVFKLKRNTLGAIAKFKARLVAKGYVQRHNVDYWETYAPTAAAATLRTFLTVCAKRRMKVNQIDVTTAFLYG